MRLDSLTDSEIFRPARPAVACGNFAAARARARGAGAGPQRGPERRAPVSLLCVCSLCRAGAALEVRVSRQDGALPSVAGDQLIVCPCLPAMPALLDPFWVPCVVYYRSGLGGTADAIDLMPFGTPKTASKCTRFINSTPRSEHAISSPPIRLRKCEVGFALRVRPGIDWD